MTHKICLKPGSQTALESGSSPKHNTLVAANFAPVLPDAQQVPGAAAAAGMGGVLADIIRGRTAVYANSLRCSMKAKDRAMPPGGCCPRMMNGNMLSKSDCGRWILAFNLVMNFPGLVNESTKNRLNCEARKEKSRILQFFCSRFTDRHL
jgi:hypothetical protein